MSKATRFVRGGQELFTQHPGEWFVPSPAAPAAAWQYRNKSSRTKTTEASGNGRGFGGTQAVPPWGPGNSPEVEQERQVLGPAAAFRSVVACHGKAWSIWLKHKITGERKVICFKCRSWRHRGPCRLWRGAQDFVRIKKAMGKYKGWLYFVLTFDPEKSKNEWAAYRSGIHKWNRLRMKFRRRFGKPEYIQTWESTRKGLPHVNVVVHNEALIAYYREDPKRFERELKDMATSAGFGWQLYVEEVRTSDAMAGYLVKLARELVGAAHKDQVPENAPRHFRRIRASQGLLEPAYHNPDLTGGLILLPLVEAQERQKGVERLERIGQNILSTAERGSTAAGADPESKVSTVCKNGGATGVFCSPRNLSGVVPLASPSPPSARSSRSPPMYRAN